MAASILPLYKESVHSSLLRFPQEPHCLSSSAFQALSIIISLWRNEVLLCGYYRCRVGPGPCLSCQASGNQRWYVPKIIHYSRSYTYKDCYLADILNYALTLEHLEATFYQEGLQNYTQQDFISAGYMDPFYANLQVIASDEQTHEQFLTQALSGMFYLARL